MLLKSAAVIRTHSWDKSAPIGWIAWKPGMSASLPSARACASAMRGSVS